MLDIKGIDIRDIPLSDVDAAAILYNRAEIAAQSAKGMKFSRAAMRRGRKNAISIYRPYFEAAAVGDPSSSKLKGGYNANKLAGYAWYGAAPDEALKTWLGRLAFPKTAELMHLYVDESYQGQGLGKALFTAASHELRGAGFARMRLFTERDNHLARAMYENLGGKTDDRTVGNDEYGTEMVQYLWNLKL